MYFCWRLLNLIQGEVIRFERMIKPPGFQCKHMFAKLRDHASLDMWWQVKWRKEARLAQAAVLGALPLVNKGAFQNGDGLGSQTRLGKARRSDQTAVDVFKELAFELATAVEARAPTELRRLHALKLVVGTGGFDVEGEAGCQVAGCLDDLDVSTAGLLEPLIAHIVLLGCWLNAVGGEMLLDGGLNCACCAGVKEVVGIRLGDMTSGVLVC